jgi:hypothetical protein
VSSAASITWRDGVEEIRHAIPQIVELIAATAKWVHPDTFRALPVWYPENARARQLCNAGWSELRFTRTKQPKLEGNGIAGRALKAALDVPRNTNNWTVCHIWGYDDPTFAKAGSIVRDPRFYSCVGNMVWLPTPLKGFTDSVTEIKTMLRICAYHLYDWTCEHEESLDAAKFIRRGKIPNGYPKVWPTRSRRILPPGTAPYSPAIERRIAKRKAKIKELLATRTRHFPREEVVSVLDFWKIKL